MGLDMYLYASRYVGYGKEQLVNDIFSKMVSTPLPKDRSELVSCTVSVKVAYWRKANHIHTWFVNNVQGGVDDCREYTVEDEDLSSLIKTCTEVLQLRASAGAVLSPDIVRQCEQLLTPSSGFFFGSTNVDEYYFESVEYTRDRLTEIMVWLKAEEGSKSYWDLTYRASW